MLLRHWKRNGKSTNTYIKLHICTWRSPTSKVTYAGGPVPQSESLTILRVLRILLLGTPKLPQQRKALHLSCISGECELIFPHLLSQSIFTDHYEQKYINTGPFKRLAGAE